MTVPRHRPDSSNQFCVSWQKDMILILRDLPPVMTPEQAINLAAWLCCLADPTGERFAGILKEIQNT